MKRGVQRVMGVVPTRLPMPSLGNIFVSLKNKILEITATDLEITVTAKVEILESEGEGSVLIQAKRFQDIINQLPDVPLEIEVQESLRVTLRGEGVGEYILPGGDPIDFPELPVIDARVSFNMSGEILKRLITKTMFAVSHDEMRPILTGVLIQLRMNEICIVATDGHRLSRIKRSDISYTGEEKDVVVPMKALNQLMHGIEDDDEPTIGIAETRASFTTDNQRLTTRLIDGHYPNYKSVIPEDNPNTMTVNTDDMMSVVKRISVFAHPISHQVKITIKQDSAKLEAEDPEIGGRGEESIAVNYEGEPLELAYNCTYLADVLRQIDTEEAAFKLNTSNDAAVIRSTAQNDDEDLLMLLMPIRLNR